jgi:ubiquinone/menaquinone biosynthesis C-methylase UbiE
VDKALGEVIAEEAASLLPLAAGARVVEVDAGLGALTLRLARAAARVDAVDGDKAIVAALKARLSVARLTNVEPRVGDAAALPFAERTFDAAYCASGAPDDHGRRAAMIAELRRVLKPGASAAVAAIDANSRDAVMDEMIVAGFDDIAVHAVGKTNAFIVTGIA